jgi:hypothetical protein
MLDPTRFALNAETVGFRQRMGLPVDWGAFNQALQTQSDCVKVRRELEETPTNEIHVMGGQRFGLEGNAKTNERSRQHRQMNGYVLRSFLATGGPVILPPKKNDSLLAMPTHFGHVQYTPNAVLGQQYVSKFTEPLNAPLENNTILLGRAGIEMKSNSISNPYAALQFQMNMEHSQKQIQETEDAHQNKRSRDSQTEFRRQQNILNAPKEKRPQVSAVQQVLDLRAKVPNAPPRPPRPLRRDRNVAIPPPSSYQLESVEESNRVNPFENKINRESNESLSDFKKRIESMEDPTTVEDYNPYNLPKVADLMENYEDSQNPFENEHLEARVTILKAMSGYTEQEIRFSLLNNNYSEDLAMQEIGNLKERDNAQMFMDLNQTSAEEELDSILNSADNIDQTSFMDFDNYFEEETFNMAFDSTPVRVPGSGASLIMQNGFQVSDQSPGFISPIAVMKSAGGGYTTGTTGENFSFSEDSSTLGQSAVKQQNLGFGKKSAKKDRPPMSNFVQYANREEMIGEDYLSRNLRRQSKAEIKQKRDVEEKRLRSLL